MEKLYSKDSMLFSQFKNDGEVPYKLFYPHSTSDKMDWYATQFSALNDYAYFISQTINDRIKNIDESMKEILDWLQDPKLKDEDSDDLVDIYLGHEEDKNLWMFYTELISTNTIIMSLISFCEGTLKEITVDIINKFNLDNELNLNGIKSCLETLYFFDKNDLLKKIEKDISIIKKAKRIRNTFAHEQWMTNKNNKWDFKTRKSLNKISISDLINAITHLLETVEKIGIENEVYESK